MKPRKTRKKPLKMEAETTQKAGAKKEVRIKRDTPGKTSQRKLSARAKAQKELEKEHAFEGSLTTIYQKPVEVNQTVRVLGLGELFSGDYLIESVEINFEAGTLETRLELSRDVK